MKLYALLAYGVSLILSTCKNLRQEAPVLSHHARMKRKNHHIQLQVYVASYCVTVWGAQLGGHIATPPRQDTRELSSLNGTGR